MSSNNCRVEVVRSSILIYNTCTYHIAALSFAHSHYLLLFVCYCYRYCVAHDFKVHATYLADLKQQLTELQQNANHDSDKLDVALKFIDWFTETKLQL